MYRYYYSSLRILTKMHNICMNFRKHFTWNVYQTSKLDQWHGNVRKLVEIPKVSMETKSLNRSKRFHEIPKMPRVEFDELRSSIHSWIGNSNGKREDCVAFRRCWSIGIEKLGKVPFPWFFFSPPFPQPRRGTSFRKRTDLCQLEAVRSFVHFQRPESLVKSSRDVLLFKRRFVHGPKVCVTIRGRASTLC